jgi:hypothetical protein
LNILYAGKMQAWNLDCLKLELLFIIKGTHLQHLFSVVCFLYLKVFIVKVDQIGTDLNYTFNEDGTF